ncbi:MAG: class I SAM-dependent rRNA methyltransferase [Cryomorphaceae bacterium]
MSEAWLRLKKGREKSVERGHPWVFSGAVQDDSGNLEEGQIINLLGFDKSFLGKGMYACGSLCLKVLTLVDEPIDQHWFDDKLKIAFDWRVKLGLVSEATNAYRLLHGEGDGIPGLIIDIYHTVAVIQPHAKGMTDRLSMIVESLKRLGFIHIVHKPIGKGKSEVLLGEVSERTEIKEDGLKYHVDVLEGQKTGFFIDQRDNRQLLKQYSRGNRVLNVFSYTGGFSISAAQGGANEVISIDASTKALALAESNAHLNGFGKLHTTVKVDAVPYLEGMAESFDVIVLDPPAFAKHKSARHSAIQAYRRINQAAIEHLPKGGVLFTFSCSQVVDRHMFDNMLLSAAVNAGKRIQILHKLRQPADHPVNLAHPEGEYLKGLVVRIMD